VFDELTQAVEGKTGAVYTRALREKLRELAGELRTPGSPLNDLLTRKDPLAP